MQRWAGREQSEVVKADHVAYNNMKHPIIYSIQPSHQLPTVLSTLFTEVSTPKNVNVSNVQVARWSAHQDDLLGG